MVSRWASVILLLAGLLNRYWRVSVATVSSIALAPRLALSALSGPCISVGGVFELLHVDDVVGHRVVGAELLDGLFDFAPPVA